jgi:hypothetical protein
MSCLSVPHVPTNLPFGLGIGIPKAGVGPFSFTLCCTWNIPLAVSTDDLLPLLAAIGITPKTLSWSGNLLKPVQAKLIAVNRVIDKLQLNCPLDGQ